MRVLKNDQKVALITCQHLEKKGNKYTKHKVPLRDVPRGVAQERIEKHNSMRLVSYAYDIILRRYQISVL